MILGALILLVLFVIFFLILPRLSEEAFEVLGWVMIILVCGTGWSVYFYFK
jgi:hypothetical protein